MILKIVGNLTLTRVVFELHTKINIHWVGYNLTLTRVVFEFVWVKQLAC